jgi:hypothetical protein
MKRLAPPLASLSLLLLLSLACALPSVPVGPGTSTPRADSDETPAASTPTPPSTLTAETPTALDPCLLGIWTMDTYALNNKFLDLTASPSMSVIGGSFTTVEFRDDNTFSTSGQITIRFDIPGTTDYIEMDGFPSGQGSYAADGSTLTFSAVDFSVEFSEMRAFINGQQSEAPFGSIPMPENALAPPASAAYTCSGSALNVTYAGAAGTVTEEWAK